MVLYIKNPIDPTKILWELKKKKVKLQKIKLAYRNLLHFYMLVTKLWQREIKKTIPLTIASKRIKYIGINLTKKVKNLYSEKYKTLIKETEEDTNKWKHITCSWTGKTGKSLYRFSAIPVKIPMAFFTELK